MTTAVARMSSPVVGSGEYRSAKQLTSPQTWSTYLPSRTDYIDRFYRALRRWHSETTFLSDSLKITEHPDFRRIVKLGRPVVPLILGEIQRDPSILVYALEEIESVRPYPEDDEGDFRAMSEHWISWAERERIRL